MSALGDAAVAPKAAGGAAESSSSWMPSSMPLGSLVNVMAAAAIFVVISMIPVDVIVRRFPGGFKIPVIGLVVGVGHITLLLKSLAAGAAVQALLIQP
jgi:hypothetical protein